MNDILRSATSNHHSLAVQRTFEGAVATTLEAAIRLMGAHRGNVQLPAGDRLYIVENRGFAREFLDTFREVRIGEGSACGRSFEKRRPVVIPDVAEDAEFSPFRSVAARAGFQGVVTTPMATTSGVLMGFVSVHFVNAHRPTPIELRRFDGLCAIAANHLQVLLGADTLDVKASQMQAAAYKMHWHSRSQFEPISKHRQSLVRA